MNITLKDVEIRNFLSVGEIDFKLDNRGVVLIEGQNLSDPSLRVNGAGKSTMLSSIFFAIYGKVPSKDGAKADDVIHRKVGKRASVKLTFLKGGKEFVIFRSRKPNKVTFHCDGEDLTTNSASNTDKLIQQTVGISEQLFLTAILFDSINSKRFAAMTDKERKEMFTELLHLSLYSRALELAKGDLKEHETKLSDMKAKVSSLELAKQYLESNVQKAKEEHDRHQQAVVNAHSTVDNAKRALQQLLDAGIEQQIADVQERIQSLSNPDTQTFATTSLYNKMATLQQQERSLTQTIQNEQGDLRRLLAEKEKYEVSDICPTCGNEMDAEHKTEEVQRVIGEIHKVYGALTSNQQKVTELATQVETATQEYNVEQEREEQYRTQQSQSAANANTLNNELWGLTQQKSSAENAVTQAEGYVATLTQTQPTATKTLTEDMEKIDNDMATLQDDILTQTGKIAVLEDAVKAYSDTGVKSHMIDQAVPQINKSIAEYLGVLSGATISVQLTTQKVLTTNATSDKIDLVVDNLTGAGTYSALSAGEKRRVDIAISLAFQDLVMSKSNLQINTLFYDEVFENLDEVGCENTVQLLKERLGVADSIFVITHNEKLKTLFNNVSTVIKENGFSRLEETTVEV